MRANTIIALATLAAACSDGPAPPSAQPITASGGPTATGGATPPGATLFEKKGCVQCHGASSSRFGPSLRGKWGKPTPLSDGTVATFDAAYVRESILAPNAKLTLNYPATMPSFQGLLSDAEIAALTGYLETL